MTSLADFAVGMLIGVTCATTLLGLAMGGLLDRAAWRAVQGEPRESRNLPVRICCAALYLLVLWRYGITLQGLEMGGLASVLLVASLTDLYDYLIPNGCIVAAIAIRVSYLSICALRGMEVAAVATESLVGAVAVTLPLALLVLVMDRVLGRPSMGGGDLKLFAVAGLYFGWQQCIFLVAVACLLGIAFALAGRRRAKTDGPSEAPEPSEVPEPSEAPRDAFPFGPSIAAAMVVTMLCGGQALAWYIGLLV